MLLYDRLLAYGQRHGALPQDPSFLTSLREAQVFDLTSVVPLFEDWEQGRDVKISKRPPYPTLWAEWWYEERGDLGEQRWRIGALLSHVPKETGLSLRHVHRPENDLAPIREDFWTCDEFYTCKMFNVCHKNTVRASRIPLGQMWVEMYQTFFGMREEGCVVRTTQVLPDLAVLKDMDERERLRFVNERFGAFGLPVLMSVYSDRYHQFHTAWPALMAFALLHCANVVPERVDPTTQLTLKKKRAMQKHGIPLPVVYQVLKVEVPVLRPQRASGTPEPRPSTRLHLCRGHFKNLQHERFVHKGFHWWPAHWRGDPDRGLLLKDYRVTPRSPGQGVMAPV